MDTETARYWEGEGATKTFSHPLNLDWLGERLTPQSRVLDYGCGYGRVLGLLAEAGYRELLGVDASGAMIEKARAQYPGLSFQKIDPPRVPMPDASFDAVLLFAVLTCIPGDAEQRAVVEEIERILRPGGLLYLSDYWLQDDERNRERYGQSLEKYGTYGVFEVAEGVAVRHHRREWIDELLARWDRLAAADFQVITMNGHKAAAFQWLGRRP
jgi:SAM-dependent methyltransferase